MSRVMQMKLWLLDDVEKVLVSATELPPTAQSDNGQNLLKSLARVTDITFPTPPSRNNKKKCRYAFSPPRAPRQDSPRSTPPRPLGARYQRTTSARPIRLFPEGHASRLPERDMTV